MNLFFEEFVEASWNTNDIIMGCLDYGYGYFNENGEWEEVSGHRCVEGANHDNQS